MKSVIVEIKDDFAAVLSDDGCVTKIKNRNYTIGQVIELKKQRTPYTKKLVACAATAAILLFGTGTWAYASPYSYVSIDINPSIEFTINRFDRVLSVKAVNNDGENILANIKLSDLENQTIETALTNTVESISSNGYFNGETPGGIIIATSGENKGKADALAQDLKENVETILEDTADNVEVEAISVLESRVKEAKELGVTPGKLNLVEKLKANSKDPSSINTNEWLKKPVKDIMRAIKEDKDSALPASNPDETLDTNQTLENMEDAVTKEKNSTSEADSFLKDKHETKNEKKSDKNKKNTTTKSSNKKVEKKSKKVKTEKDEKKSNKNSKKETKVKNKSKKSLENDVSNQSIKAKKNKKINDNDNEVLNDNNSKNNNSSNKTNQKINKGNESSQKLKKD